MVTSTGKVGKIEADASQAIVRRRSFLDYLYFTDYETVDPALYTGIAVHAGPGAGELCARYYYDGSQQRTAATSSSSPPTTINGPLHSNDAILDLRHAALQRHDVDELDRRRRQALARRLRARAPTRRVRERR